MTPRRLVLSRRVGESLLIGQLTVTVTHIGSRLVTLLVVGGAAIPMRADGVPHDLGNGCSIALADIQGSQCKLRMMAADAVRIMRTELL